MSKTNFLKLISENVFKRFVLVPHGGNRLLISYLRGMFIFNPTITLLLCFVLNGTQHFLRTCAVGFTIGTIVCNFCWAAVISIRQAEVRLAKWFKKPRPQHGRMWGFLMSFMAMPAGLYLACAFVNVYGLRFFGFEVHIESSDYRASIFTASLISGVFFLIQTVWDFRESARSSEKIAMQAQISALSAQMNPHLLFNALNTVASLVETDPKKAEGMILSISDLYRRVLTASKKATHTLEDEIALCRAYLDVEGVRFGSRLKSTIDVQAGLNPREVEVPALSLQPLVENAVKHGISARASGGTILVRAVSENGKVKLSVEDDGAGMGNSQAQGGTGTGLSNCRERYKLQYGTDATFSVENLKPTGTRVAVSFPGGP